MGKTVLNNVGRPADSEENYLENDYDFDKVVKCGRKGHKKFYTRTREVIKEIIATQIFPTRVIYKELTEK